MLELHFEGIVPSFEFLNFEGKGLPFILVLVNLCAIEALIWPEGLRRLSYFEILLLWVFVLVLAALA